MTKLNVRISITAIIISIFALATVFYFNTSKKEIYFVDTGKLYDEFVLKKEYESQIQNLRINRKNIVDSLEFELGRFQNIGNREDFAYLKEEFVDRIKSFEEEEESLLNEYNSQIWKRLNQYAIEYGKLNNIDFLFGSSGDGNLMHTKEEYNKTNELIAYANKRYRGK